MIEIKLLDERTGQSDAVSSNLNPVDMVASDWQYLFRAALAIASWDGEQIDNMVPMSAEGGYRECACQCKKETPAWVGDMLKQLNEIVAFHVQDREKWARAVDMIETLRALLVVEG